MRELKTLGFHHITMVSRDAQRTLDFYAGVLGLPLVKKTVNFDDPSAYHLYFADDRGSPGTILTFFEWSRVPRGRWGVGGVHHLALGTATPEDLLRWKRRLADLGVPVSGPYDRGYFQSIYFSDPDGQILEIATRGPGYGFDEPMDALGTNLMQPAEERLPAGRDEAAIAGSSHPHPVPEITESMRLEGIHHISAITDDLERAHDFYSEALGLSLVKKTVNQDDGKTLHFFWAAYDGQRVAPHSSMTLFGWSGSTLMARGGSGQTHHVAFRADDEEQQLAWREHLLGLGLSVSPVMDRTYFRSIYFQAPDGLLVEIATDGPGFAVDEPATSLGRSLKLPDWLEPRREGIEESLRPLEVAAS
jgi:glyoxalase family protein